MIALEYLMYKVGNNLKVNYSLRAVMDRLMSMRVFESVIEKGSFAGAARALDL